jgi:hypothetical protein
MKSRGWLMLGLTLLPVMAWAGPGADGEQFERAQKQARMKRVLSLAEELELSEAQALKMSDTMRQFDERRQPLLQQVQTSARILRQAARGDASVNGQVEQAVQRVFEARTQLTALDRELYQALAKDLPPQKQARLAIFLARHEGAPKWKKGGRDERD